MSNRSKKLTGYFEGRCEINSQTGMIDSQGLEVLRQCRTALQQENQQAHSRSESKASNASRKSAFSSSTSVVPFDVDKYGVMVHNKDGLNSQCVGSKFAASNNYMQLARISRYFLYNFDLTTMVISTFDDDGSRQWASVLRFKTMEDANKMADWIDDEKNRVKNAIQAKRAKDAELAAAKQEDEEEDFYEQQLQQKNYAEPTAGDDDEDDDDDEVDAGNKQTDEDYRDTQSDFIEPVRLASAQASWNPLLEAMDKDAQSQQSQKAVSRGASDRHGAAFIPGIDFNSSDWVVEEGHYEHDPHLGFVHAEHGSIYMFCARSRHPVGQQPSDTTDRHANRTHNRQHDNSETPSRQQSIASSQKNAMTAQF